MAPRGDDELRIRARQQAAVAELGQRALAGLELDELLEAAAVVAAEQLEAEFVPVLELTGDGLRSEWASANSA